MNGKGNRDILNSLLMQI